MKGCTCEIVDSPLDHWTGESITDPAICITVNNNPYDNFEWSDIITIAIQIGRISSASDTIGKLEEGVASIDNAFDIGD